MFTSVLNGNYCFIPLFQEFSIDCILRQTWRDERLSYEDKNSSSIKLELDSKQLGSVWQPDLYFKNEKRASIHTITNSNKLMHIYKNGTIVYSMRYIHICLLSIKRIDTHDIFFRHLLQGRQMNDFLLAFLPTKSCLKMGILYKQRLTSYIFCIRFTTCPVGIISTLKHRW